MLRELLWIIGLEQWIQAVKDRTEARAQALIRRGKVRAAQVALATILIMTAVAVLLMSFVPGLIVLFLWLEPQFGSRGALGIVAGALLGLAVLIAVSAALAINRRQPTDSEDLKDKEETSTAKAAIEGLPQKFIPGPASSPVSSSEVDAFLSFAGRFAHFPRTGIEPIDNLVVAVSPKAEEVAKEVVARAASLVRSGDTATILSVLGAAAAAGWLLTKAVAPKYQAHTTSSRPGS